MDNPQWRLSQAHTYALYISKHISITLIPYHLIFLLHVNLFLLLVPCLWHILYLYFFCIPISILYIFLYLSCVHLSRLSYVFSMFLFFFRLYIMSLVYVFFIFRFYDLLHSMYYYIYFTYICTFLIYHILCAFVYFLYLSCVDLSQYFHIISLFFVLREFLSHLSYLP